MFLFRAKGLTHSIDPHAPAVGIHLTADTIELTTAEPDRDLDLRDQLARLVSRRLPVQEVSKTEHRLRLSLSTQTSATHHDERHRFQAPTTLQLLRVLVEENAFHGLTLIGAVGYDAVKLFFPEKFSRPQSVLFSGIVGYPQLIDLPFDDDTTPALHQISFDLDEAAYRQLVEAARAAFVRGDLMEVVLSREVRVDSDIDARHLFQRMVRTSQAPYLFHIPVDGTTTLVGASPEFLVYVNGRQVYTEPISGTVRAGSSRAETERLETELLASSKEKAELDMLIDLARSDLARVCQAGIQVARYRELLRLPGLTHTIAEVSGELDIGFSSADALFSLLNAGTLTGAPKIAAMELIDQVEPYERRYYGGVIVHAALNGNTTELTGAITIRTAEHRRHPNQHVEIRYRTGATLLYLSTAEGELEETKVKARDFFHRICDLKDARL